MSKLKKKPRMLCIQLRSITCPLVQVTIQLPLEKIFKWNSGVWSTVMLSLFRPSPGTWGLQTSHTWRKQIQPPSL